MRSLAIGCQPNTVRPTGGVARANPLVGHFESHLDLPAVECLTGCDDIAGNQVGLGKGCDSDRYSVEVVVFIG